MNIAYHYCAIKALARSAGFRQEEAQIIAEYSQFVDDFNLNSVIETVWAPQIALDIGLTKKLSEEHKYSTEFVMTGFRNSIDYLKILRERAQNRMVVPFHFILKNQMNSNNMNDVTEPADLKGNHLIGNLLRYIESDIIDNERYGRPLTRDQLIRLGMILHVFADTYAHQKFSGRNNPKNKYTITHAVKNNPTGMEPTDVTREYQGLYSWLPPIGHAWVSHAPDDTFLDFRMVHKDTGEAHQRSNINLFVQVSRIIFESFKRMSGTLFRPPNFSDIEQKLRNAFLVTNSEEKLSDMMKGWGDQFKNIGDIDFSYDREAILRRMLPKLRHLETDTVLSDSEFLELINKEPNELTGEIPSERYAAEVTPEFWEFMINAYEIRAVAVDKSLL